MSRGVAWGEGDPPRRAAGGPLAPVEPVNTRPLAWPRRCTPVGMSEAPARPSLDRATRLVVAVAVLMALAFSTGMAVAFEVELDAPVLAPG